MDGQKCCCHTHLLTPVSIHPHQRVSHPWPTIYVPGKYLVSQWCPWWCSVLCVQPQAPSLQLCCLGLLVQSCTGSSCSPFCNGCKQPHICFEHFNDNQRQHKISLAFRFPGLCSAGVRHLGNSFSAFNSGETCLG